MPTGSSQGKKLAKGNKNLPPKGEGVQGDASRLLSAMSKMRSPSNPLNMSIPEANALMLYRQNAAKFGGSGNIESGLKATTPYNTWVGSSPYQRSWVGDLLAKTPLVSPPSRSYMRPTWYGSGGGYSYNYSSPLILDRMARDVASGRVTLKDTLEALYQNRGNIRYTKYGQEIPIPGTDKTFRPVEERGIANPGLPLFNAVKSTQLKWKPLPPRFVPDGNPTNQSSVPKPPKSVGKIKTNNKSVV